MIVLHAVWSARDRLCLFAEDPARVGAAAGRKQAGHGPPPAHPFTVAPDQLVTMLGDRLDAVTEGAAVELDLVLPSTPARPLASPAAARLARDRPGRARPRLLPWRSSALALGPAAATDLVLALDEAPPAGTVTGDSVAFFARAAEVALDLVGRGRVLPALVERDGAHEARWRPAPTPPDHGRLSDLARAMPPSCRAEWAAPTDGSPGGLDGRDPGELVARVVGTLVDAAARTALSGRALAPPRRGRRPAVLPAAEAFLLALVADDPRPNTDPGELAKLGQALDEWRRSGIAPAGPLRTCLRLTPPEGDEPWRLEILLQSTEDPSLLVPAEEVWRGGPALSMLGRDLEHPQERLLADLGRASRLYPALDAALDVARPAQLELDAAGAFHFLATGAPLLEQAGYGVLVPAAQRLGARLAVRSSPAKKDAAGTSAGLLGLEGLCQYHYEVALGDDVLSARELRELACLKAPLVRVRGRWVELRGGDLDAALALLARQAKGEPLGEMTAVEALRVGLGLADPGIGLPVVSIEADGWLGELLSADAERRLEPVPTPAGFHGTLRPYQERGLAWLSFLDRVGLGACLADDMGLGKTVQLLALLLAEREVGPGGRTRTRPSRGRRRARPHPTLLVCPMSVVGNWQREAERFAPSLAVHVHHGAERETGAAFHEAAAAADLVVTTYALVTRDRELLAEARWARVVLDEAQAVKNPDAKQTAAVRAVPAARRLALTGTPVENRLSELWSIMEFLNPGLLGSRAQFRSRFAVPVERYRDEEAAAVLKRLTAPFVLRRLKTDRSIIADLPDKIEMKVFCNLTREQATLYQAVVDDMLARVEASEGIERKGLVLSTMLKLKQVCNHPAHLLGDGSRLEDRSGKLARLEEIVEEVVAEGDRALCFTQFAEMGRLLQAHLQERVGREVPFLHGGVRKPQRDEMVAAFQAADAEGPPLLVLSLKAGGVGLNLTAANHVVHFDRWWNPAVEDQATDRAFRIGQRRNVQVRKFVCVGTLEERIDRMIEEKRDLAERIVGTGEAWLTELSTAQLRELVALSADAVAEG